MLLIALKLLVRERAKYLILVCVVAFAALLIVQQLSVGSGLIYLSTANILNLNAPIWVVDRQVEEVNAPVPLRSIEVQRVRSVAGVAWAYPVFLGPVSVRLPGGRAEGVSLVGIDATSLVGRPEKMLAGRIEDLRLPDAVVISRDAQRTFAQRGAQLTVGDAFEINDRRARIVGVCEATQSLTGQPIVFTSFDRALGYAPRQRNQLSAVLVAPATGTMTADVVRRLSALRGLRAVSREDFFWQTIRYNVENTAIPVSFGIVVALGIAVGVIVAGQTFYLFIGDNLPALAAFKVMGASNATLVAMVFVQTLAVGFLGFGFGMGCAAAFGAFALATPGIPFVLPLPVIGVAGGATLLICGVSAALALWRIAGIEPASVFK
jgi:putative ABC transport system permease protein